MLIRTISEKRIKYAKNIAEPQIREKIEQSRLLSLRLLKNKNNPGFTAKNWQKNRDFAHDTYFTYKIF